MTYAISLDLDTARLQELYPNRASWQSAYSDIRQFLLGQGFEWQQGSLYFGRGLDAVQCVPAAQKLSRQYDWFKPCVRDIRMLRIEELNDLSPAL